MVVVVGIINVVFRIVIVIVVVVVFGIVIVVVVVVVVVVVFGILIVVVVVIVNCENSTLSGRILSGVKVLDTVLDTIVV